MSSKKLCPPVNMEKMTVDRNILNSLNEPQEKKSNFDKLNELGGVDAFIAKYFVESNQNYLENGLLNSQVETYRALFGENLFPETPIDSFLTLFIAALTDPILLILILAAVVSLIVGLVEEPEHGWTEGVAIFIAVILVSFISAGNDYSKQLQFRDLEQTTANDELSSVFRNKRIERIHPREIVIGDIIVLQVADNYILKI